MANPKIWGSTKFPEYTPPQATGLIHSAVVIFSQIAAHSLSYSDRYIVAIITFPTAAGSR